MYMEYLFVEKPDKFWSFIKKWNHCKSHLTIHNDYDYIVTPKSESGLASIPLATLKTTILQNAVAKLTTAIELSMKEFESYLRSVFKGDQTKVNN